MKTTRILNIALCAVLIALTVCVPGCDGPDGKEGLLWAWPSKKEAETLTSASVGWGHTAFFRFRTAPAEGSFEVEVRPGVPFIVGYAGQMVFVKLDRLAESLHEVTLKNRNEKVLGKAYLGRPQPRENDALVNIVEKRTRSSADGGGSAEQYPLALAAKDGCSVRAGFGSVAVEIRIPAVTSPGVTESLFRDAVTFSPSEGVRTAFRQLDSLVPGGESWLVFTVEWPGVEISGRDPVDPVEVLKSSSAPPGFALKMQVSVDSRKLPFFKDVSGADGVFKVVVSRAKPSSWSIRSLEDETVTAPLKGFRTIRSVKAAPHRFSLTFTKPVDRASVERALVFSVMTGGPVPSFSFNWKSDTELECTLAPPDLRPWGGATFRLNVTGSFDREGLPLWFLEPMVVRFALPVVEVRVSPEDPGGTAETVGELPPGISAVIPSPGREYLLGLEATEPQYAEGPKKYHPWLYSSSTGKWTDLGSDVRPLWNARWLDEHHVIAWDWDWDGWEIIQVPSGRVTRIEWKDRPGVSLLGLCPSPDGKTLAIIQGKRNTHSYEPADLLICDLEGNVLKRLPGITGTDRRDFYRLLIPLLYTGNIGGTEAGTQETPRSPGVPETPGMPGTPERPGTPGASKTPATPETPGAPETPRAPETQGTPSSQGAQCAAAIGGTIFLVDRLKDGPTRILQVNVESGKVSAVPGTEYASRSPHDALAVFGKNPTYLAFVNLHDEEEMSFPGTPDDVHIIDLDRGMSVGFVSCKWPGEFIGRHLLPSPDGRFLLAGSTLVDVAELAKRFQADRTGWPELPGSPVDWSPDGNWIHVLKSAQ